MNKNRNKGPRMKSQRIFNGIFYPLLILISAICVLPFLIILSGSMTDNGVILREGFSLIPKQPTLEAYRTLFQNPTSLISGYRVTIIVTAVGTSVGLFLVSLTGFVLSRKEQ